jgi:dethiobiotin synthetase
VKTLGLFVTATDTGVGKTYLTALIARELRESGLRVGAYKPVCTGGEVAADGSISWSDVDTLIDAIGGEFESTRVCPRRFQAALAPPVAARLEGTSLELGQLCGGAGWWQGRVDILLVEGVGGLLCPLTEDATIAEFGVALGFPLLIVARLGLGTINHTLLTVEAARRRDLRVAAVVLNEAEPLATTLAVDQNAIEIARRANVPMLGVVRHGKTCVEHSDGRPTAIDWHRIVTSQTPTEEETPLSRRERGRG